MVGPIEPGLIWIGWISLAALVLYLATCIGVARTRRRHQIFAPAMTGHPEVERALRVQANTLEQLVPFLVALWLCARFWEPLPAAVLGVVWLVGRTLYALGYYRAAGRRGPGFVIGMVALVALIVGAAIGLVRLELVLG
ncbi:MAG TPA: MAPEG family protein [Candidatus Binatia bacterium]|nr:MAPEG family protein [Candidatus Binatia bacterium]